jgi:hypothetical protein
VRCLLRRTRSCCHRRRGRSCWLWVNVTVPHAEDTHGCAPTSCATQFQVPRVEVTWARLSSGVGRRRKKNAKRMRTTSHSQTRLRSPNLRLGQGRTLTQGGQSATVRPPPLVFHYCTVVLPIRVVAAKAFQPYSGQTWGFAKFIEHRVRLTLSRPHTHLLPTLPPEHHCLCVHCVSRAFTVAIHATFPLGSLSRAGWSLHRLWRPYDQSTLPTACWDEP